MTTANYHFKDRRKSNEWIERIFGNIPMFQKQVEREIEEKGIKPSEGIKKWNLAVK